ncbi:phosphatase PAP2 family protein [Nocardioides korecus]
MTHGTAQVVWAGLDDRWFRLVNAITRDTPWLHAPATAFAKYGVVVFAGLLVASWLLAGRDGSLPRVAAALWAPIGALIALGVNQVVGAAVAEPRPYAVLAHVEVLVSRSADFSFPSDHAVMAGAAAAGVLLAHRRLGVATAALALLMAATRVYVGAHFPLDVVAGLLLGAAVTGGSWLIIRPLAVPAVERLARTPLRPLLTTAPVPASLVTASSEGQSGDLVGAHR